MLEKHGFERIESGNLVATYARSAFEDTRTDGATHTYWVTAVDSQLAESVLLGTVEL